MLTHWWCYVTLTLISIWWPITQSDDDLQPTLCDEASEALQSLALSFDTAQIVETGWRGKLGFWYKNSWLRVLYGLTRFETVYCYGLANTASLWCTVFNGALLESCWSRTENCCISRESLDSSLTQCCPWQPTKRECTVRPIAPCFSGRVEREEVKSG